MLVIIGADGNYHRFVSRGFVERYGGIAQGSFGRGNRRFGSSVRYVWIPQFAFQVLGFRGSVDSP